MRALKRPYVLAAPALVLASSWYLAAGISSLGADYASPICDTVNGGVYPCDDPAPSIEALIHGHLGAFFAHQPPMGSFSILLRAPFVALAGASDLARYRFGAFACLVALGLAGLLAARAMEASGSSRLAQLVVFAGFLLNPLTFKALYFGHPEELLAGGMVVAALLLAARGRAGWAGVLLGAAVATKSWALLGVGPILLAAAPQARRSLLAAGLGTAALLVAPMALGNLHMFEVATRSVSAIATRPGTVTPANLWWSFAHYATGHLTVSANGTQLQIPEAGYALPAALGELTHPLIIALVAGLTLLYWRRRASRDPAELLILLALIFLIRCALDPFTLSYHHAPLLLALLTGEGLRRRGLPVVAALSALVLYLLSHQALSPATFNASYLAWALGLGTLLTASLFAPTALERIWPRADAGMVLAPDPLA